MNRGLSSLLSEVSFLWAHRSTRHLMVVVDFTPQSCHCVGFAVSTVFHVKRATRRFIGAGRRVSTWRADGSRVALDRTGGVR